MISVQNPQQQLNGNNNLIMRRTCFIFIACLMLLAQNAVPQQDRLKEMRSTIIERKDGKEYYIHTVKRGQTLYMISKAYGVEVTDIIQENPEVKEGIKSEQKLRIPKGVVHEPVKKQPKVTPEPAPVTPPAPPPEEKLNCEEITPGKGVTYSVALMMPLYLNEVAQMNVEEVVKGGNSDARPLQFIEFYEGFRMALDSLKKSGISLQITVYDVAKDTARTKKILREPELKKCDLIIGLLYNRAFQLVEEFAERNNIPLINPLSERDQITEGNPTVIKVIPTLKSQIPQVSQYLSENFPDGNVLILHNSQPGAKDAEDNLLKESQSRRMNCKVTQSYEATLGAFSKEQENVIFSYSENKATILDLITKLNEWRNEYRITLIGLPRWDKLEDIEVDYLVNLKTHIVAPFFIDYSDPAVKRFVTKFQERYKTDPDQLAFQGFDAAFYFITGLAKYGKSFERCLPNFQQQSLLTSFQFTATKGNGFINQHWEIYHYDNFSVKRAEKK
jgi:ABC-type branched-subunit amino acid transport system substrate-binding protein